MIDTVKITKHLPLIKAILYLLAGSFLCAGAWFILHEGLYTAPELLILQLVLLVYLLTTFYIESFIEYITRDKNDDYLTDNRNPFLEFLRIIPSSLSLVVLSLFFHMIGFIPFLYLMPYVAHAFILYTIGSLVYDWYLMADKKSLLTYGLYIIAGLTYYYFYKLIAAYIRPVYEHEEASMGFYMTILFWLLTSAYGPYLLFTSLQDLIKMLLPKKMSEDTLTNNTFQSANVNITIGTPQPLKRTASFENLNNIIPFPGKEIK